MTDETLFAAALEKQSPAERAAFLDEACADDPAMRRRVEALLHANEKAGRYLERPALEQMAGGADDATAALDPAGPSESAGPRTEPGGNEADDALDFLQPSTRPGSLGRLGHYEVLEVLGRGGFGIVLKAFDDMLWTFMDGSFVPHEMLTPGASSTEAPVLLSAGTPPSTPVDIIINLAPDVPTCLAQTRRVAEIIDGDDSRRRAGRARFKAYRDLGIQPASHNIRSDSLMG